jgi:two-component system nitrogen regulation sensor histidine kinase NtrY
MVTDPDPRAVRPRSRLLSPPGLDFATFRRQETVLILLNLAVLAGLMLVHTIFRPVVGRLSAAAGLAFALRFTMQLAEVAVLNDPRGALGPRATWWYARLSIAAHVGFTALVSRLSLGQESHYAVLMVIPVIAAAFRLSPLGLASMLVVVIALTIGLVWIPVGAASPGATLTESFEATTVSLIFVVVAAVVRLVAAQLWRREGELRRSIEDLAATRDRLVREENLAAVGRLASAIAHEVRNPVSMIASAVATARRPETAPDLRAEVFDILAQESQRLQRLTEDFLTYARQRPPQRRRSSLGEALELVAGLVRARAEELGIALQVDCQDAPTTADPFQLQQALLNLAMNALEATPRGGALRLAARADSRGAVFSVEDTGPALSPVVVARIGEPFFTTKPRGTGLGLAIARTIARAHGGEITLAENLPGRVRFELRIGAAREEVA